MLDDVRWDIGQHERGGMAMAEPVRGSSRRQQRVAPFEPLDPVVDRIWAQGPAVLAAVEVDEDGVVVTEFQALFRQVVKVFAVEIVQFIADVDAPVLLVLHSKPPP